MYRFYIGQGQIEGDVVHINGPDVNHIKNVLRLERGDWVVACDGEGTDRVCRVQAFLPDQVDLSVEKVQESGTELDTRITLFQGIPKKDKMEWIIQKTVELGVYEIVPVMMRRCVVRLSGDRKIQARTERWRAIAEAAAKQCDRGIVPEVHSPVTMQQAINMASALGYNMIPYELQDGMEASRRIVEQACQSPEVGIFIGPEGGLEKEEVEQAVRIGAEPLSLGKRILRTETAGMALISRMMFQMQK